MKIIVPMAGIGSRLRPHTLTTPKPLTLTTLWVGENINPIVELAWLSWLKQGYKVYVYVSNIIKENLNDLL